MACKMVVQEAIWFIKHLGVQIRLLKSIPIYCDSMTTSIYTKDPKFHGKTKHVDSTYNFI